MPTKRELREIEETENTVEIDIDEIKKELEKDQDQVDIPDFANKYYDERPYSDHIPTYDPAPEEKPDRKPIIVGVAVFLIFLIVSFSIIGYRKAASSKPAEPENTPASTDVATAEPTHEPELGYFYLQQANTAIINRLNEEYGVNYTKPTSEQFKISGSEQTPSIDFDLTVGNTFKKNYVVPVHVELAWNNESQTYDISSFTADESNAEVSEFKSHSTKKEAKKQAESSSVEGKQVSNFTVTVNNSVTVNITSKGEGEVSAYATAEDGTRTKLASVSNGSTSKTVKLDSGKYELTLYAVDGVGYSWDYKLQ